MSRCLSLLLILFLAGCASRGPLKSLNHSDQDSLAVGRLTVNYNQKDLTAKSSMKFVSLDQSRSGSGTKWSRTSTYAPAQDGLVVMTMPVGRNYLAEIQCLPPGSPDPAIYRFAPGDMVFEVTDPSTVYYLGDIRVDWSGPASKSEVSSAAFWFGAIGAAIAAANAKNDGKLDLAVSDQFESCQSEVMSRYPEESLQFNKTLLPVKPSGKTPIQVKEPEAVPMEKTAP